MLTKSPDYMISDYGCPELWSATAAEAKHLNFNKLNSTFWNSYSSWCNNKSSQLTKLLPLRETWTDYYTRHHMQQQHEESQSQKYNRIMIATSASMNLKQQKNHHNEMTKNKSFHYNNSKRFNDATTGPQDAQQRRPRPKPLDNELDQF